jgi:hypothetical protein
VGGVQVFLGSAQAEPGHKAKLCAETLDLIQFDVGVIRCRHCGAGNPPVSPGQSGGQVGAFATATPQPFTVASRPGRERPSLEFPSRHEGRVRTADQPESTGLELAAVMTRS